MAGLFDRIGALAGTDLSKAADLAHRTFQGRMGDHHHAGRALVETVAEICREHPNLVGIGAGLLVEQLLVREKEWHDAHLAAADPALDADTPPPPPVDPFEPPMALPAPAEAPAPTGLKNRDLPHHMLKLGELRPGRVAMEVFGGILVLKLAATGAKLFRHKRQGEIWFAQAARIRLFSGTIAAYNLASAIRSPKISAWRNGAILFFGTDAVKPLLKLNNKRTRLRA